MKTLNKNTTKALSVVEATDILYSEITKHTGWKFLKSSKSIKKVVGDLVFVLQFYSSKWNNSYNNVEIQCEFRLWCKKFDKTYNIKSSVGFYKCEPNENSWWNITHEDELAETIKQLCSQIDINIIPLYQQFEDDFNEAVKMLANTEIFDKYHICLNFIDIYAGREHIIAVANSYYNSLSDVMKEDVLNYKNGLRNKSWMYNPSNLKYIIDNEILSIL